MYKFIGDESSGNEAGSKAVLYQLMVGEKMKQFTRISAMGVLLLVLSFTIVALAQNANWISGIFEVVAHKNVRSVGGKAQTVYSGQVARTYRFTSQNDPSGLWAVADGDSAHATPIPTSSKGGAIEKSGKTIAIELRTENQDMVSTGWWIDVPQHDNVTCGTKGSSTAKLQGLNSTQPVYSGATNRIFRFTSQDYPTFLWVKTDAGAELPIPTFPTAIDIGGTSLTVVVKTDQSRTACWQDITN